MIKLGRICTICGIELTDENWYPSDKRTNHHRCKSCSLERGKIYEKKNKEKVNNSRRNFRRKYRLGQANNVVLKVVKRDWTGKCELCNKENIKLDYHHWDNNNFMKGLWLCRACHWIAEDIDSLKDPQSKSNKYLKLKETIEEGSV